MPDQKERISAHIAQLEDMRADYPEASATFRLLTNHLKGLLRVRNTRTCPLVSDLSKKGAIQNGAEA
tara:strand:- start:2071 stop:2271 length:201 start_codon:yes stop_codon:yes gene_type:complete